MQVLEGSGDQAQETLLPGDNMKQRTWHQHSVSSLCSHPYHCCPPCSRTPYSSWYFTKRLTQGQGLPAQCRSLSPASPPLPAPNRCPFPCPTPAPHKRSRQEGGGEEGSVAWGPDSSGHGEAPGTSELFPSQTVTGYAL